MDGCARELPSKPTPPSLCFPLFTCKKSQNKKNLYGFEVVPFCILTGAHNLYLGVRAFGVVWKTLPLNRSSNL